MQDDRATGDGTTTPGKERATQPEETRFDEMRHRYANAVQLAASTLAYEALHCADAKVKELLAGAAERLAVLHHLYLMLDQDIVGESLSMRAFLEVFCTYLRAAYFTTADFTCTAECDELELAAETCRLLGRAVHELVVNAVKHAFAGKANGRVTISLRQTDVGMWRCSVEDDGVGFAAAGSGQAGLGRNLVVAMARQLGGRAVWEHRVSGSAVHLLIPLERAITDTPLSA